MAKKILLVGGTGFVGMEVGLALARQGHELRVLTRQTPETINLAFPASVFQYDGENVPDTALQHLDVIINFAGASIIDKHWSRRRKRVILESRTKTAKMVREAAEKGNVPVVIQTSAVGYYGDTDTKTADEDSKSGRDFLANTAKRWEEASALGLKGTRTIVLRLGVVLGRTGGALPEMITPYVMGIGACLGKGRQYFSWIHIDDVCDIVSNAVDDETYSGVYNLVSPSYESYMDLHRYLAGFYKNFRTLKIPAIMLKLVLGQRAILFLASQKVAPKRLAEQGYSFRFKTLQEAMYDLFDRSPRNAAFIEVRQWVPAGLSEVWDFFSVEKNLEKMTPPYLNFHVDHISTDGVQDGSVIDYSLKLHGIPIKWRSKIIDFQPKKSFRDIQLKGPYKIWDHEHKFEEIGQGTLIEDFVKFRLPFGFLGHLGGFLFVRRDVRSIFAFRKNIAGKIFKK